MQTVFCEWFKTVQDFSSRIWILDDLDKTVQNYSRRFGQNRLEFWMVLPKTVQI
jgi:hypothetical protein